MHVRLLAGFGDVAAGCKPPVTAQEPICLRLWQKSELDRRRPWDGSPWRSS